MNIEGFRWYDPSKKNKSENSVGHKVSRREYWRMVGGAFAAFLPFFFIFIASMGVVVVLAYLWLS